MSADIDHWKESFVSGSSAFHLHSSAHSSVHPLFWLGQILFVTNSLLCTVQLLCCSVLEATHAWAILNIKLVVHHGSAQLCCIMSLPEVCQEAGGIDLEDYASCLQSGLGVAGVGFRV